MIREAIKKIVEGHSLSEDEMIMVINQIMEGGATDAQIASFITALRVKGETVEEITAAARVMKHKALDVFVKTKDDLIDIVGTGGDGTNTFNISTAAAFVVSGAGLRVAKHGNRAVSSRCGSADVMESLGINININPECVGRCIDEIGIGFLFAQKLHLAMKNAASVRKEIGIRTLFNIIGPLTNPAGANIQVIGVYEKGLTELIANVLKNLGRKRAIVVHGNDGLDEITLSSDTIVSELKDGFVKTYNINARDFGLANIDMEKIRGGTPEENSEIILNILKGSKGAHRDIVLANAAAAIMASEKAINLKEGMTLAAESIDSGKALNKLIGLKALTNSFS